ncbi:MAG: winged helix-turn-helix domain-containing protein [Candidatus Hodarchaeales archaeon]
MTRSREADTDQESQREQLDIVFPEKHEKFLSDLFLIVSHAVRRDLIRLIGGWEKISFTDLINETKLSPGTFYYHLKKMPALVQQEDDKRYSLTHEGRMAYEILEHGENQVLIFATNPEFFDQQTRKISSSFLQKIFKEIKLTPRTAIEIFGLVLLQVIFSNLAEIGFILLLFDGAFYIHPLITVLEICISIIIIWIFIDAYFFVSRGRKSKQHFKHMFSVELFLSIPVCITPLFLIPVLTLISELFFIEIGSNVILFSSIMVILQLISGYLLLEAIQVTKSVKFTEAIIPVFIVLYCSSFISMILV